MSTAEFRRELGIAPNTLTRMRMNEPVSLDILCRVCEAFDVDFGEIISYKKYRIVNRRDVLLLRKKAEELKEGTFLLQACDIPALSVPARFVSSASTSVQANLCRTLNTDSACGKREDCLLLYRYLHRRGYDPDDPADISRFCQDCHISHGEWLSYLDSRNRIPSKTTLLKMILGLRMSAEDAVTFLSLTGNMFCTDCESDMLLWALISENYMGITEAEDIYYYVSNLIRFVSVSLSKAKRPPLPDLYASDESLQQGETV
jgi:DNA-binding Xre family transcriptional regulator